MRIRNREIENFVAFLMTFELIGKESRLRTRFVKLLASRVQQFNEEHGELIKEYSNLDSEGTPITKEVDGVVVYDIEDKLGFTKEYHLLLNEDFHIEENENNSEMLFFIKDLILDCDKTFSGREALEYDNWCEIVETINII